MINLRDLFHFGSVTINLYGILFGLSVVTLFLLLKKFLESKKIKGDLLTMQLFIWPGVIVGTGILCNFYSLSSFIENPLRYLYLAEG